MIIYDNNGLSESQKRKIFEAMAICEGLYDHNNREETLRKSAGRIARDYGDNRK
ncbi:MAG TPA: hypothetical protein VJZ93_01560 [Candidatus Nanoarchaeia archaeon]|nr:hypothetical protein [Candidatus Nanoarchaeia archaeon]